MIFNFFALDAPATAPNLTAIEFAVNEGKLITLQCRLPSLGYPPIIWSWMCGGDNLTLNASKVETQSTLIFTADKKYNGRSCQCWATSPEPLLSYNKTSETKTINVFCRLNILSWFILFNLIKVVHKRKSNIFY